MRVRELGWNRPVLLLEGVFEPDDLAVADRHRLTVSVHCDEQLDMLAAARPRERIDIQLKMNSGIPSDSR